AGGLDRAVGQANLALGNFKTSSLQAFGDVAVGDRTEQTAVNASLLLDGDGLAVQALTQGLGSGQLVGLDLFEFGAANFEFLDGRGGGTTGLAGGDQEVTGEAVLDLDHVTQVAQVRHFFEQDDLHVENSLTLVLVAVGQHGQETSAL